jgi:hypothetical protein
LQREESFRRAIRSRLLALILALALTWYALNPALAVVVRADRRETEPPDEQRHEAKTTRGAVVHTAQAERVTGGLCLNPSSHAEEVDELEWPEVIDIP